MTPVIKLYNYYLSPEKEFARALTPIIGFTPRRISLFKLAFYHKSMNNVYKNKENQNNERLEYLGDAILSTIVADYLFTKYPYRKEGFLTKMRSKIVQRKTLNTIAEKMGLDILLSSYSQGKLSTSMLGNAFEALIGALYIELGYEKTKRYVISNILMKYLDIHQLEFTDDNYKSVLLEWCQKNDKKIEYITVSKYKFNKRDMFKMAVLINGTKISVSEDFNKKAAEQAAAQKALEKIKIDQKT